MTEDNTSDESRKPPGNHPRTLPATLRANVARALNQVLSKNRTIDWIQLNNPHWLESPLSREILYGTLRHYFTLAGAINRLLKKPLRSKDGDLYCLLLVGAYQLTYSNVASHAAVNETVSACKTLRKPWAKGLLNATLRNFKKPEQTFDHPEWMVQNLRDAYPELWRQIIQANNLRAPMSLRVNSRITSREAYLRALAPEHSATPGVTQTSLVLDTPVTSRSLPGWDEGAVAVQDMGAQCAAPILASRFSAIKPLRVLDACAAPGGKLSHLAELLAVHATEHTLLGIDLSPARVTATREILDRLGHTVPLLVADASLSDWWDGQPFSHILLDAPCSGSGTLRRHPDIKVLLQPEAIADHARTQMAILNNLWTMLAPGGYLLYCTCSLLPQENDAIIEAFLEAAGKKGLQYAPPATNAENVSNSTLHTNKQEANEEASVVPITLPTGRATTHGWQLLPTDPRTDGFYYALLTKPEKTPSTS